MNLSNMKLATRLALGFGMLVLFVLVLSGWSLIQTKAIRVALEEQNAVTSQKLERLYAMREALAQTGLAARNAFIFPEEDRARAELDIVDQQKALYLKELAALAPQFPGNVGEHGADAGLGQTIFGSAQGLPGCRCAGGGFSGPGSFSPAAAGLPSPRIPSLVGPRAAAGKPGTGPPGQWPALVPHHPLCQRQRRRRGRPAGPANHREEPSATLLAQRQRIHHQAVQTPDGHVLRGLPGMGAPQ